jgi:tetratricopeptide (TPR) repeat protein
MSLMLNCIVKNESERIERMLASVAPYISSYVVLDTGSTDDTKERIRQYMKNAAVSGVIYDGPFENFSQARNLALAYGRERAAEYNAKFFLLCDADMQLVVRDTQQFLEDRSGLMYEMFQHAGPVHYTNARLLNVLTDGKYKSPTHEYLDVRSHGRIPESVAYFIDHADGSNRPEKCERDIRLLLKGLKEEPTNARYMYYLASSYRDAGQPRNAAAWYRRRIAAGGWDEEVWQAHVSLAHALKDTGETDGFVANLLAAYSRRPVRAEAMYDLAHWYREQKDQQAAALACAEAVEHLPKPADGLFVNDYVYSVGIKEEISITAAYVPYKFDKGRRVTDELAIMDTPYWTARACARANTYWYVRPIKELCPSFEWKSIPFRPPENYVPMNPSVVLHHKRVYLNVRCVNYRIDEQGRYIITATDGTANASNPIDTRNFIMDLGGDLLDGPEPVAVECYRPGNLPCEFPLVTGFEDVRLFSWREDLWCTATMRQLAADGQCEQVLSRLADMGDHYEHTDVKRMLREPRETEKNWAPIQWEQKVEALFVWRPGIVLNSKCEKITDNPPSFMTDNISGSSQLIHWGAGGWLAITHTAHPLPNEPYKRYYFHRFIEYGRDMKVKRMSLPWVFHDRVIEFCGGMCWAPDTPLADLVISYGYKDCEARLATVSADDVDALLQQGHVYDRDW